MPYQDEVSSVIKGFRILSLFRNHDELGVTEIAQAMGMAKGSVYRFLTSLKRLGLLEQNPQNERYRPAVGLLELSSIYMAHLDWHGVVRPLIGALSVQIGETVHLAIREDTHVVYIDKIEGQQSLRMVSRIGLRRPAHCTGTGKAMLAALNDQEIWELYRGKELERCTQHTITDLEALVREIGLCRQRVYSVDAEENELGIICIGAAIRDQHGNAVAAISASGPTVRLCGLIVEEIGQQVAATAREASRRLGCRPPEQIIS